MALTFFKPYLEKRGYSCEFQVKNKSPILHVQEDLRKERNDDKLSMNLDGVAIIYKTDKFQRNDVIYIDMVQNKTAINALAVPFTFKLSNGTNVELLVVTTHPKSSKDEKTEKLRQSQLEEVLTNLIPPKELENKFLILACDLNSAPNNEIGYEPLCYPYLTNTYGFQSCYKSCSQTQKEPSFTTVKKRETGIAKNCLDYIFVKNNTQDADFEIVGYLDIPKNENILLPNWYYPSDHLAMVSQILFSSKHV